MSPLSHSLPSLRSLLLLGLQKKDQSAVCVPSESSTYVSPVKLSVRVHAYCGPRYGIDAKEVRGGAGDGNVLLLVIMVVLVVFFSSLLYMGREGRVLLHQHIFSDVPFSSSDSASLFALLLLLLLMSIGRKSTSTFSAM